MRAPRLLRNIWEMVTKGKQELEVTEELTNAYFGDPVAWQTDCADRRAAGNRTETEPTDTKSTSE